MAKPDGMCGAIKVQGDRAWTCTLPADHRDWHCDEAVDSIETRTWPKVGR